MASEGNQPGKVMWDSSEFASMYASAEKLTGHFAELLVQRAGLEEASKTQSLVILDEACGTGIVSFHLMNALSEQSKAKLDLTCADFAQAMVDFVARRIESSGWKNVRAVQSDAMDTKLPSDTYTHVFLNFGPMVFPDWRAGMREIHRMLRSGGTIAMSSWRKIGWVPDIRTAFDSDPEIPKFPSEDELRRIFSPDGGWDDPAWIAETVRAAGFVDVEVREVPHSSVLDGVDEFIRLMVGTVGMVISKTWTAEQQDKFKTRANDAVATYMRRKYGDGQIQWDWIAILTVAKKPA